ncbi:stalk domain-containing protein [Paenibacillus sp. FSL L8-0470]|uniref:stalk domain-containing protein n=1 Tax=unclassified Paenibacillus TaxID=185978 RepID=UPI0030FA8E07
MKKLFGAAAIALFIAGCTAASPIDTAHAASPLLLAVDGQPALTPLHPFHSGGILYVPARVLLEYYPCQLIWDNVRKQLTLSDISSNTVLTPGSSAIQITYTQTDGSNEEMQEGPVIVKDGHNYIPADTLYDLTGAESKLETTGNTVSIVPGSVSTTVRVPKEPLAVAANNSKIKLYTALKNGDTYKGFILEVNGRKQTFNWSAPRIYNSPPELHYADVDNDGKPEAIVILTRGTGTGIVAQEVHVVKPELWKELSLPAADKAAATAVTSSLAIHQKDVLIRLEVKGAEPSKLTLRLPGRATDNGLDYFGKEAGIGAVTYYQVEGGKLKAETSVMVGMQESIGTLMLEYKAGGKGMELGSIKFEPDAAIKPNMEPKQG